MIALVALRNRARDVVGWAQVDSTDLELVMAHRHWHRDSMGYPATSPNLRLHRLLLDVPKGLVVDHINHDKFDNRRSNLRVVTQRQNVENTSGASNRFSAYRGVYFDHRRQKWYGQVKCDGIKYSTGAFHCQEDAAHAVATLRREIFGARQRRLDGAA